MGEFQRGHSTNDPLMVEVGEKGAWAVICRLRDELAAVHEERDRLQAELIEIHELLDQRGESEDTAGLVRRLIGVAAADLERADEMELRAKAAEEQRDVHVGIYTVLTAAIRARIGDRSVLVNGRSVSVSEVLAEVEAAAQAGDHSIVCADEGGCHGAMNWCELCGDVAWLCGGGADCDVHAGYQDDDGDGAEESAAT